MGLFRTLAEQRDDLRFLQRDTEGLLRARHFVAHAVFQEDAVTDDGMPALFILSPKQGETMLTLAQAEDNARMIREGRDRTQAAITAEASLRAAGGDDGNASQLPEPTGDGSGANVDRTFLYRHRDLLALETAPHAAGEAGERRLLGVLRQALVEDIAVVGRDLGA
jgi:hypothetical protein